MGVWRPLADDASGYLFSMSDSLRIVEAQFPGVLTPVDSGTIVVASDYSGQHKESTHETYSFLITTESELLGWLPVLGRFREEYLPDGRRLSFKKLNEPIRWRALPAFLGAVAELKGNLITFLVDKRIGSFLLGGADAARQAFPDCFGAKDKPGTIEKMLRLASFVALILSGLRREDQVSKWISDQDETLDSDEKRENFARLASYLTFGLTGWLNPSDHLFCTTETPTAPYWSEDIAAVADLAAGAYCQLSGELPSFFGRESWLVGMSSESIDNLRAREILNWLATSRGQMKHVLLRLGLNSRGEVRTSAQAFQPRGVNWEAGAP